MELLILIAVFAILAETSYLTYKTLRRDRISSTSILMDTSALIDGRIVPIARSGLVSAPLIVPKSVVAELQFMADRADHDKRERARFGLDVIDSLQHIEGLDVKVIDDHNTEHVEVDEQLMRLAIAHKARLCTIDYNLNKAARVQKIDVININELAHALRIVHLPGEQTSVKIVQAGQERDQGVGYLDDGTMMVVEDAKSRIDQEVEIIVTRVLQTAAGKMAFAKLVGSKPTKKGGKSQPRPKAAPKSKHQARKRQSPQARAESNLVALANQDEKDPR